MIAFIDGDIFDIDAQIRVNTVNCVGVMGAGVALAFKNRYPEMFKEYRSACKSGLVIPGRMHVWRSLEGAWVVNFPTKRDWRKPSRYDDIEAGLDDLRRYLDSVGPVTVALPALGCGNGGLDWGVVSNMIREKLDGVNAEVFVLNPSASRRAGASIEATDEVRKQVKMLGYAQLCDLKLARSGTQHSAFTMGPDSVLERQWLAVFPSRNPSEREFGALRAIAAEIAASPVDVSVALVYSTLASEKVAGIFAAESIGTVVILPFGVLTRKSLAKNFAAKNRAVTLVSFVSAEKRWSIDGFASTIDIMIRNSASVLLSDPAHELLSKGVVGSFLGAHVAYVNYGDSPPFDGKMLAEIGAAPIVRRVGDGAPKISRILAAFEDAATIEKPIVEGDGHAERKRVSGPNKSRLELSVGEASSEAGYSLGLKVNLGSNAELAILIEALRDAGVGELDVRLQGEIGKMIRDRLIELGLSASKPRRGPPMWWWTAS